MSLLFQWTFSFRRWFSILRCNVSDFSKSKLVFIQTGRNFAYWEREPCVLGCWWLIAEVAPPSPFLLRSGVGSTIPDLAIQSLPLFSTSGPETGVTCSFSSNYCIVLKLCLFCFIFEYSSVAFLFKSVVFDWKGISVIFKMWRDCYKMWKCI